MSAVHGRSLRLRLVVAMLLAAAPASARARPSRAAASKVQPARKNCPAVKRIDDAQLKSLFEAARKCDVSSLMQMLRRWHLPATVCRRQYPLISVMPGNGWPRKPADRPRCLRLLRLLIKRGADVNAADKRGWTPLMMAATRNDLQALELLRRAGARINDRTDFGSTALILAADRNSVDAVRWLLEAGADPKVRNGYRKTALDEARHWKDGRAAALLQRVAPQPEPPKRATKRPASRPANPGRTLAQRHATPQPDAKPQGKRGSTLRALRKTTDELVRTLSQMKFTRSRRRHRKRRTEPDRAKRVPIPSFRQGERRPRRAKGTPCEQVQIVYAGRKVVRSPTGTTTQGYAVLSNPSSATVRLTLTVRQGYRRSRETVYLKPHTHGHRVMLMGEGKVGISACKSY